MYFPDQTWQRKGGGREAGPQRPKARELARIGVMPAELEKGGNTVCVICAVMERSVYTDWQGLPSC